MKLPPVAATAVPLIAKNSAISEMAVAAEGRWKRWPGW